MAVSKGFAYPADCEPYLSEATVRAILLKCVSNGCWGKSMTNSQIVRTTWVRRMYVDGSTRQRFQVFLGAITSVTLFLCHPVVAQPIVDWDVSYEHAAPQLSDEPVRIENLGNGRYRAVIDALASDGQDVLVDYEIDDGGNANPPPFQLFINRLVDGLTQDQYLEDDVPLSAIVAMGETPSNRVYSLRVRVSDGLDLYDQTRQFVSPPSDPQMQFFVDVAGDGAFELAGGGQNYIEFNVEPGVGQTVISGFVRHPNGAHADFDELVLLSNSTPELAEARVITVDSEAFEVVLATQ